MVHCQAQLDVGKGEHDDDEIVYFYCCCCCMSSHTQTFHASGNEWMIEVSRRKKLWSISCRGTGNSSTTEWTGQQSLTTHTIITVFTTHSSTSVTFNKFQYYFCSYLLIATVLVLTVMIFILQDLLLVIHLIGDDSCSLNYIVIMCNL